MKIQLINNVVATNYLTSKRQEPLSPSEVATGIDTKQFSAIPKIYAITSPNFKSSSLPVEVTSLYNKKTEGKDHLDLPHVHVYEFPDTKHRLYVNVIKLPEDKNEHFMYVPQVLSKISTKVVNDDLDKDYSIALNSILCKRLNETSEDVVLINEKGSLSFFEPLSEGKFDNIKNLNQQIFNLKITDDDIEFLNKNTDLGTKGLSKELLQKYYDKEKNNFTTETYVVISENDLQKKDRSFLQDLNIKAGLKSNSKNAFCNTKQNFVEEFSALVLTSHPEFNEKFEIKANEETYSSKRWIIQEKQPLASSEIQKIKNEIISKKITSVVEEIKEAYKIGLKNSIVDNNLPIIRIVELSKYGTDVFNLFEIIDSISEEDVKNCIKNY